MENKFIKAKAFFSNICKPSFLADHWREGTTTLLHAPRAIDKTVTALSIANKIASKGRDVLYINADKLSAPVAECADCLYVYTPEFESIDDQRDYADIVFQAIEDAVRSTDIRTFVIDSVTRIAALSFGRNSSAAYVMKRLVALQVKCRLSILAVADDTSKAVNNALLALAADEITIEESAPKSDTVPSAAIEDTHSPAPIAITPTLTRQQRRALERKQIKSKKNAAKALSMRNYN